MGLTSELLRLNSDSRRRDDVAFLEEPRYRGATWKCSSCVV